MKMVFYLQPGKRKAKKMLRLWTEGAARTNQTCVVDDKLDYARTGYTSVFYGVADSTFKVFNQAVRGGKPWLYIDNQYFPTRRGRMYRVTWNGLQANGYVESDGRRLDRCFGGQLPKLSPWHKGGKHILITLQSELYFKLLMPYSRQQWLNQVVNTLKQHTDRPIIVREKPHPSKPHAQKVPFETHLYGCHAIVTLNSATAIEGIMRGIPGFVTDPNCAIVPSANTLLSEIENPLPFDRMRWLATLADNQWSSKEIETGSAVNELKKRVTKPVPDDLIQRSYKLEDIK